MMASCSRLTLLTVTWRLATFVDCGISDGVFLSTATWWSSGSASDVAGTESDAPRYVSVYPWLSGIGPPTALPREDDVNHRGERSEEHTSELQSRGHLVCRLLLEKKKTTSNSLRTTHE